MPYVDVNGDVMAVELGRLERTIMRNALNRHQEELEKAAKNDRKLGVPNEAAALHLAVITGEEGWGQGLYAKLSEQMSIDDEIAAIERAIDRTLDVLATAGVEITREEVASWTPEQREAVQAWAPARSAQLQAGSPEDAAAVAVPEWPLVLLDALLVQARALDDAAGLIASLCPMTSRAAVLNSRDEAYKAVRWAMDEAKARLKAEGTDLALHPKVLAARRVLEKHHAQPL